MLHDQASKHAGNARPDSLDEQSQLMCMCFKQLPAHTCFFIILRSLADRWRLPAVPSAPPSTAPSSSGAAVCAGVLASSGADSPYLQQPKGMGQADVDAHQ